jgi:cytochrome c oxidase assembly protein subunit 15
MVFAMAVIGAITRLTESGLSMVEWRPLIGWIPPLSEAEWQRVYKLYQQSPEFIHKHNWMSLADFKNIYFWEWFHRLWGRLIGVVYALPLAFFWLQKRLPAKTKPKLLFILFLGLMQGLMGWYMVMSGLVDIPRVSHFRLAAHLMLALLIFACLYWTALEVRQLEKKQTPCSKKLGLAALFLLVLTILWGAFVAGLDAGLIYNSFPLMGGKFLPPENFYFQALMNEQAWVQFVHRWLAVSAGVLLCVYALKTKEHALLAIIIIQISLGISTLVSQVYIPLAALHQAGAIILLGLQIRAVYRN